MINQAATSRLMARLASNACFIIPTLTAPALLISTSLRLPFVRIYRLGTVILTSVRDQADRAVVDALTSPHK